MRLDQLRAQTTEPRALQTPSPSVLTRDAPPIPAAPQAPVNPGPEVGHIARDFAGSRDAGGGTAQIPGWFRGQGEPGSPAPAAP